MIGKIILYITIFYLTIGYGEVVKYIKVKNVNDLNKYEGKKVIIEGSIAEIPWQHLIDAPVTHPNIEYFNSGKNQIVIYTKGSISCTGKLKISGTVIKVQGKSKRPGSNEIYTEYHIIVDKWKCIK